MQTGVNVWTQAEVECFLVSVLRCAAVYCHSEQRLVTLRWVCACVGPPSSRWSRTSASGEIGTLAGGVSESANANPAFAPRHVIGFGTPVTLRSVQAATTTTTWPRVFFTIIFTGLVLICLHAVADTFLPLFHHFYDTRTWGRRALNGRSLTSAQVNWTQK